MFQLVVSAIKTIKSMFTRDTVTGGCIIYTVVQKAPQIRGQLNGETTRKEALLTGRSRGLGLWCRVGARLGVEGISGHEKPFEFLTSLPRLPLAAGWRVPDRRMRVGRRPP